MAAFTLMFLPRMALAQRPQGVDVSSYEGNGIIWSQVKSSGVSWAFVKAAEGTADDGWIGQDPDFTVNIPNAKTAGVIVSYYYYCHPESDPGLTGADAEAAYFWSVIKPYMKADGLTMMPMLDFEQDVTKASPAYTAATLSQWVNEWCQDMVNDGRSIGLNVKPIIYTFISYANGTGGYGPGVNGSVTQWPLNMANVNYSYSYSETYAPSSTYPWSTWAFWQYNWYGIVPGIPGNGSGTTNTDLDVFNGTSSQMLAGYVMGVGPTISTQPASVSVLAGTNVTLSVTSPNATHYQWELNGTNISGATLSSYTINNVKSSNAGGYNCLLTNANGSSLTAVAFLSVVSPLTNAPSAVLAPANMVNWWPADGHCIDIFGTGNGTPVGDIFYSPGKSGQAFHFDGSTTAITTSVGELPVPWTLCMWVNYTYTPQTSGTLFGDNSYALKLEQYNATHQVGLTAFGVGDYVFSPAYTVPQNTWTHLAFVGTSSGTTLYVNGVQKATLGNSIPLPRAYIGASHPSSSGVLLDCMQGNLDDVMVFSRALSQTELSSIYSAGSAGFIRAPIIAGAQVNTNGQFVMNLKGFTGKNYTIYSSSNLVNWANAGTLPNSAGTNAFTVSNATNNPQQFYRVSQTY